MANGRISAKGVAFVARWEGFRGHLYNDVAGHCTIGYGHLVHLGRCNGSEPADLRDGITDGQALAILERDASTAVAAVKKVNLRQHAQVPAEFAKWTNHGLPGLVNRRRAESALYTEGTY